jgi:hypothetical protein
MKVSTKNDNNFGYEKITILVENISLRKENIKNKINIILILMLEKQISFIVNNPY